ncbi:MAG: glutathione S-transferase family protein [Pseudomonadota bacterium]
MTASASAPVLRIFSYLPNPRVWKALFAARLGGVEIETVGDKPGELGNWLWDTAPRPLNDDERNPDGPLARRSRRGFGGVLYKTDAFLEAHPFGTVPAAFGGDENVGIFESNSILRAVARSIAEPPLYGTTPIAASRIDSFLDANLVFAREAQVYLLALQAKTADTSHWERMQSAYEFYLAGIEAQLGRTPYLAGDAVSIADLSFVCDLAQFLREGHYPEYVQETLGKTLVSAAIRSDYPRAVAHMLAFTDRDICVELKRYLRWWIEATSNN